MIMNRQRRVDNIAIATENHEEVGLITVMALLRMIMVFLLHDTHIPSGGHLR